MNELKELWKSEPPPGCVGCSVLGQNKPFHADLDFDVLNEADVAFVSDSIRPNRFGQNLAFQTREAKLIDTVLGNKYSNYSRENIPSVRCPNVKEADISAKDMKLCREYLYQSLSVVKPKLVFACGNLAMRMLLKKSGIKSKRGELFPLVLACGHETIVAPIYSPTMVCIAPEEKAIFTSDIYRAYDKVILGKTSTLDLNYTIIESIRGFEKALSSYTFLENTEKKISIDLETTGLNFLEDKILTIGICWGNESIIIPIYHRELEWSQDELDIIRGFVSKVMKNPNNKKIFHNAKFDLKFLLGFGIKDFAQVQCTKLKYHVTVSENDPKSLRDLVKKYFPQYLETF
jgi:uracil-DNA glycosylase family 4